MPFNFISQIPDYIPLNISTYEVWLKKVVISEGCKLGEINYIFVKTNQIVQINKDYLNHNYPTDIITFDNSYLNLLSGDVFVCIDVVKENSLKHSEGIFKSELDRVIVHGLLHLLGYKDDTNISKQIMRSREDMYLKYLE